MVGWVKSISISIPVVDDDEFQFIIILCTLPNTLNIVISTLYIVHRLAVSISGWLFAPNSLFYLLSVVQAFDRHVYLS